VLTNLNFIADGQPWPPKDDDEAARLAEHATNRQIYNGLHEKVFQKYAEYLADGKNKAKQVIILDWPELATSSYMNLLVGEEPIVKTPRDEDLPERPDEEVFIDVSRYGHGMYEASEDGIAAINPENVYLVVTAGNIRNIWAYVIFAKFKQVDIYKKEKEYIKFTIHTWGRIQHLVFELANGKLAGPVPLLEFIEFANLEVDENGLQDTGVDGILIVHVQSRLSTERYYGRSDYKPSIVSLCQSLEMHFAQRNEVLSKFVNPTPIVPKSAQRYDFDKDEWGYKPGEPIFTRPGDTPPSLMVWDAQLNPVNSAIEQEVDQLLQMLQLSRVLISGKDAGTAESGTALGIRLIPTVAKVSRFARAAEAAIKDVTYLYTGLKDKGPQIEKKDIKVLLQDGIPEDKMESARVMQLWDAMKSVSLERKLIAQGLVEGSEEFNIELERLRAQNRPIASGLPAAASRLPPMGAT
jgi:hypothetical protein